MEKNILKTKRWALYLKDNIMTKEWKIYEEQVFKEFKIQFPNKEILFNQKIRGKYSGSLRQIDILVKDIKDNKKVVGAFDCKHFSKNVNVKTIDSTIGFIEDIDSDYGGVISSKGFSKGAFNRSKVPNFEIRTIPFENPKQLASMLIYSLDFSKAQNSMYIPLIT